MKKYHMMRLYQVTEAKGYIESGEKFKQMIAFKTPGEEYKPEAAYTLIDTNMIIMVERISQYLVREVKTGVKFPIVNFKKKTKDNTEEEYLHSGFKKVHTFVCARENKLISKQVSLLNELEEYDQLYPSTQALKTELLEIITAGKIKFDCKTYEEEQIKEAKRQVRKQEKEIKKEERIKIRKLKRQYRRERRIN